MRQHLTTGEPAAVCRENQWFCLFWSHPPRLNASSDHFRLFQATKHDYCITRNDEKGLVIESTNYWKRNRCESSGAPWSHFSTWMLSSINIQKCIPVSSISLSAFVERENASVVICKSVAVLDTQYFGIHIVSHLLRPTFNMTLLNIFILGPPCLLLMQRTHSIWRAKTWSNAITITLPRRTKRPITVNQLLRILCWSVPATWSSSP